MGDEWKHKLTPEQYHVLREKGTEPPFSGKYLNHNESGVYVCAACGAELFKSDTKMNAPYPNSGWPSFYQAVDNKSIQLSDDNSFGMQRTEVKCANCGGHLGHLFDDGPKDMGGGKHYCVNSICLDFKPS